MIFFPTPFCDILAAIPSDLLNVGTATPRRVFEVFRCQTRGVIAAAKSPRVWKISRKWLWKKDIEQALNA